MKMPSASKAESQAFVGGPSHCGTKSGHFETSSHSLSHKLESVLISERTNVRSGAYKQSR